MLNRIGYFVPEFPGQTHIFFWREIVALKDQDVQLDIISTRRPVAQIVSHTWSPRAQQATTYLFPLTRNFIATVIELLRCGPAAWFRCLRAVAAASVSSWIQRFQLLAFIVIGAELSAIARQRRWQHLHVHSCANAANIALFAHLLSGLPYSLTLHGPLEDYGTNQFQKWQYARFGIVITQKLHEEVEQALAGHLPRQVLIAPMGVDLSAFYREFPYRPWNGKTAFRIFSCGRLNFCKGHAVLIEAVAQLHHLGISVELAIAGEDEQGGVGYRKRLEAQIERLKLRNVVHLLGAVSEETVRQRLERSHVFALASLSEPLGVAIMEAMAMEVPVVVTNSGGVKELVQDGVDGILVEVNAPNQISDAILRLISNPSMAVRMGQLGRKRVQQQFHSRRSAEVLYKAIEDCLDTRRNSNKSLKRLILSERS